MAELIQTSGYKELTMKSIQTPEGLSYLNNIIKRLYSYFPGDNEDRRIIYGYGTPEGAVTAGIGSLYMRLDGSSNTSVYRKETGSGPTGWVAVENITLPLSVENGGTGGDLSETVSGGILYFSDTGVISVLAKGSDGEVLKLASGIPDWQALPTLPSVARATGSGTSGTGDSYATIISVAKTITAGSTVLVFGAGNHTRNNANSDDFGIRIAYGATPTAIQTIGGNWTADAGDDETFAINGSVTGLSGSVTFYLQLSSDYTTGDEVGNASLVVLEIP